MLRWEKDSLKNSLDQVWWPPCTKQLRTPLSKFSWFYSNLWKFVSYFEIAVVVVVVKHSQHDTQDSTVCNKSKVNSALFVLKVILKAQRAQRSTVTWMRWQFSHLFTHLVVLRLCLVFLGSLHGTEGRSGLFFVFLFFSGAGNTTPGAGRKKIKRSQGKAQPLRTACWALTHRARNLPALLSPPPWHSDQPCSDWHWKGHVSRRADGVAMKAERERQNVAVNNSTFLSCICL